MFKNLWGMNDTAESIRHNKLTVFAGSFPPPTRTLRYHYNCRLGLCGVIPTADSDSSVSFPPPTRTLRCHSHRRLGLCGVIPTADSDSAVSFPPKTRTLRCHYHCRLGLFGVPQPRKLYWMHDNTIRILKSTKILIGVKSTKFLKKVNGGNDSAGFRIGLWLLLKGQSFKIFLWVNTSTYHVGKRF